MNESPHRRSLRLVIAKLDMQISKLYSDHDALIKYRGATAKLNHIYDELMRLQKIRNAIIDLIK